MSLKFDTSVVKGLKLKVRKFLRLIPMFVEVTGEKSEGRLFAFLQGILTYQQIKSRFIAEPTVIT